MRRNLAATALHKINTLHKNQRQYRSGQRDAIVTEVGLHQSNNLDVL
jgi:hypothetical protein